jgi:phage-related protein
LKSNIGYHRLEDTFEPMYYRKAKYTEALDISATDQKNAAIDITFNCDARRFLKDGDNAIILTGNGSLYNPTYYDALPLIRAYGTGSFTINDIAVTITSANEYTDIDCEIMDAYKGTTNCNGNIQTTNNKFPVLTPGKNSITLNGVTRVEITPKWWTV